MEGMTIDQFKEVVEFVQKYHKFARWDSEEEILEQKKLYPKLPEHGFNIKYVDMTYDSRTSDVWIVKLRGGLSLNIFFSANFFNSFNPKPASLKYTNIFDWIMAYLKGEWYDEKLLTNMIVKE